MLFEEVKNQSVDQGPLLILLVLDKLGSSLLFAGGSHIIEMIMKLMILLLCSSFSLSFFFLISSLLSAFSVSAIQA